jgi:hypothetical protein
MPDENCVALGFDHNAAYRVRVKHYFSSRCKEKKSRSRERKLKAGGECKPARSSRLPARQLAIGLQREAKVVRAADRHRILEG